MAGSFDVFFSYSTRDHAAVERIARDLTERGIRVFLDRWYLTPGQPWPRALEQTLAACGAVAVFIGADGLGPWQQRERDLALDRQGREAGFPVIPVLLTRADPGLGFLRLNTWVDLSGSVADAEALAILTAAVRREPPGPLGLERTAAVRAGVCPYRGLRPFREEDEPFFFGRASFAETLTAAILRQPFVAVVGASGSGKSSVVRAGLIPRLRRGAGRLVWDAVTFVPTDRPLHSLAGALLPMLDADLSEVDRLTEVGKLATCLGDGTIALRDVARRVLQKQPGTDRLLLFVDQWEELYTLDADDAFRRVFVDHLLHATTTDAVRVVLTLRGDFMGHALADRLLSDRLKDSIVPIGPMTRDELAGTITRPAEKTGLAFDEGLVATILDDVGDEPGGLPLLEFLLEGLWAERRGNVLTHDAYARLGRVAGAIAHRAEEVFNQALTDAERETAQRLLIRMVRPGEGVEDTRRRAVLSESDPVSSAIILKLAHERLVVTERDTASGAVTVEVAHEALIRRWQRLRDWVDADREFLRTSERITAQARLWEADGRPSDRLLVPGRPLAEGEDLLAKRRVDLEPLLIEYIEASALAARAEEQAARGAQRRRVVIARSIAGVMAVLALVAIAGGAVAWWQRGVANDNAVVAQRNAETARRNQSRALAALADMEAETGSPARAIRMALAAVPADLATPARPYAREAEGAVGRAMQKLRELGRLSHDNQVTSAAFSPDGQTVATSSWDHTAKLWEAASGKEVTTLRGHDDGVLSAAFSPDGRTLATGSADKTARLWDVATGNEITTLHGHKGWVYSVAFNPDGRTLATGSDDHTVRLWEVATGQEIAILQGHTQPISSVRFSPDGRTLATASRDTTARLWDVATRRQTASLGHRNLVLSAAFSPDGRTLVTAVGDRTARLWDVATGKELVSLRGHSDGVLSATFSPNGRTIATGSMDKTARLWDVATGNEIATLRGHEYWVWSVAFSPDGRSLVTASADKTARTWDVAALGNEITGLPARGVWSVAFSPDGRTLATGNSDNTARLLELATGREVAVLRGHEKDVKSVAFSPDSKMLATGSYDTTARLRNWPAAGRSSRYAVTRIPFVPLPSAPTARSWLPALTTTRHGYGRWGPAGRSPPCAAMKRMSIPSPSAPTGKCWLLVRLTTRSACGTLRPARKPLPCATSVVLCHWP